MRCPAAAASTSRPGCAACTTRAAGVVPRSTLAGQWGEESESLLARAGVVERTAVKRDGAVKKALAIKRDALQGALERAGYLVTATVTR